MDFIDFIDYSYLSASTGFREEALALIITVAIRAKII
jgi:hypothetical protein